MSLKIQYCSDLHLEFEQNNLFLQQNPVIPSADILVLAGDITYLRDDFYENQFFDYISENWKQVYWTPGNHEFYVGIDILDYDFSRPIKIRENVFLVNNLTVEIDDIDLIFTTLWSKINMKYAERIKSILFDFYAIVYQGRKLDIESYNNLHKTAFNFLQLECERLKDKTKIIITHHLPSKLCVAEEFKDSGLNSAFYTELTDFVRQCGADYWIYGHSHRNLPEFSIGRTKMLTNQLGYVQYGEGKGYKSDAYFSV